MPVNDRPKVLTLFGTRPEAIKMAPIVRQLEKHQDQLESIVCVTGQHRQMLDQILATFKITPDIDLEIMQHNQALASLSARALEAIDGVLESVSPDVVLVQGDTTTAMIGALAAHYHKIPVGHVEAGLRTSHRYDPFPEEMNRRLISLLTKYHFAPTKDARETLLQEGLEEKSVLFTGNTVVDALNMVVSLEKSQTTIFDKNCRGILVTAHRRENIAEPLHNICKALLTIVDKWEDVMLVYPVHLNPKIRGPVHELLGNHDRIKLIEPLSYEDLIGAINDSYLVLTDSGGIQEEAPGLGKPVLVMRETTERPEGVAAGVAKLVGTNTDTIVENVDLLLSDEDAYNKMAKSINPYGDGQAAKRIVDVLLNDLCIA